MFRIDMIGANGVGKTTLLRKLRRLPGRSWLSPDEAVLVQAGRLLADEGSMQSLVKRLLLRGLPVKSPRKRLAGSILKRQAANDLWESETTYAPFIAAALALATDSGKREIQKLSGLNGFHSSLHQLGYLAQMPDDQAVMFDESLSHRVYSIVHPVDCQPEQLERYLDAMPLPDLLIHCHTDFDSHWRQIRDRVKRRGYAVRNSHYFINEEKEFQEDLRARRHIAEQVRDHMTQQRVPVLNVDTRQLERKSLLAINEGIAALVREKNERNQG